jgi:hypothetical protein
MSDLRTALEVTGWLCVIAFFVATCFWERSVDKELVDLNATVTELLERVEELERKEQQ